MKRLWKNSYGYTLVEFLIVIGILSLSVGSILLMLTTVIRGSNQVKITNEVKQNGQYVLDTLERQIRGAESAVEMSPALLATYGADPLVNSGISFTTAGGQRFHLICVETDPVSATRENGWFGIAQTDSPPALISGYSSLTNRNVVTGVDIWCDTDPGAVTTKALEVRSAGTSYVVSVNFLINQGLDAPSRVDFKANAQFRTTLTLRDYE